MHEESPEGGRFKKEVVVDGQSFLLLIRDEGKRLTSMGVDKKFLSFETFCIPQNLLHT